MLHIGSHDFDKCLMSSGQHHDGKVVNLWEMQMRWLWWAGSKVKLVSYLFFWCLQPFREVLRAVFPIYIFFMVFRSRPPLMKVCILILHSLTRIPLNPCWINYLFYAVLTDHWRPCQQSKESGRCSWHVAIALQNYLTSNVSLDFEASYTFMHETIKQ